MSKLHLPDEHSEYPLICPLFYRSERERTWYERYEVLFRIFFRDSDFEEMEEPAYAVAMTLAYLWDGAYRNDEGRPDWGKLNVFTILFERMTLGVHSVFDPLEVVRGLSEFVYFLERKGDINKLVSRRIRRDLAKYRSRFVLNCERLRDSA